MHYIRSLKFSSSLLLLLLSTLLLSGCAHKKLIDAGEDFNREGRYEQAVSQYRQALALKPDDRVTQLKLDSAQRKLDNWLDELFKQAKAAKQDKHHGRALLLFGKVAQLRRDSYALNQYKQLHQQLSNQYRYKIAVNSPTTLGANLGRSLKGVKVIKTVNKTNANEFSVTISHGQPTFDSSKKTMERKEQYVSGVVTVPNPDFIHLQQDIGEDRDRIEQLSNELDHQSQILKSRQRESDLLRKDLEIAKLRLQQSTAASPEYSRLQRNVDHYQQALNQSHRYYDKDAKAFDSIDKKLHNSQEGLSQHLDKLSYLSPTAKQDVLSDYHYEVDEMTRTASTRVTMTFNDQPAKSKNVTTSFSDETHDEHPRIKREFDPLALISDKKLTQQLYQQARKQAEQAIADHAKQYAENLKHSANQTVGVDDKMEAWVGYGLSDGSGVDQRTAYQMQHQLRQEFGIAGQFPINSLLDLF